MQNDTPNDNLDELTDAAAQLPKTFRDCISDPVILEALDRLGFTAPTPVQFKAIPEALAGKDLLVQAKTGSGKTLAFAVPLFAQLRAAEERGPVKDTFALVISPTRELAVQIQHVITSLAPDMQPVCLIGGMDMGAQISALQRDPRIVIGTPGRILDFLRQKVLRLNRVKIFALDEADEMLSMGFLPDIRTILSRLPDGRQGLFVSATITPRVEMLANSFLTDAESIVVDRPDKDLPPIEHLFCEVGGELMSKPLALCDLIETQRPSSAIIFCNTRSDTSLVESLLRRRGFDARRINSDLTQSQRNRVMKKIRDKELRFLVATDIAARGLDLDNIDLVINYAIHDQPETYIHRTGRTGRAGKTGRAISLIGPKDFGAFHFLQKVVEAKFQKISPPTDEEVAVARLAHLQEILRREHLDLRERDLLVARTLLNELGGITEISDEVVQFVAKLCCHAVEHYTTQEAKALDEELDAPPPAPPTRQEREERRDHRRSDQDRGDRRQGRRRENEAHRGNERERRDERPRSESSETPQGRRSDERGPERGHNDRRGSLSQSESGASGDSRRGRSRRGGSEGGSHREEDQQRSGSQQRRDPRGRGREREHPQTDEHELRVYIGQGQREGMTPQTFTDLALEFAEIPAEKLKRLSIRDRYGFVDLDTADAEKLIANLNGIQYNGALLPIERAASFREEQRRQPETKPRNPEDASAG